MCILSNYLNSKILPFKVIPMHRQNCTVCVKTKKKTCRAFCLYCFYYFLVSVHHVRLYLLFCLTFGAVKLTQQKSFALVPTIILFLYEVPLCPRSLRAFTVPMKGHYSIHCSPCEEPRSLQCIQSVSWLHKWSKLQLIQVHCEFPADKSCVLVMKMANCLVWWSNIIVLMIKKQRKTS